MAPVEADLKEVASRAAGGEAASLAFLTLRARAAKTETAAAALAADAPLARSPLVTQAAGLLAR